MRPRAPGATHRCRLPRRGFQKSDPEASTPVPKERTDMDSVATSEIPSHRAFAAVWDFATRHESKAERELRRTAAGGVSGRVLELGVGVGANWEYLPEGTDYVGIEPDPHMLQRARRRAESTGRRVQLEQARAEALPFENGSFDTVLVTLTLCTVQNPGQVLAEVVRVLKPGGQLVLVEHVRPDGKKAGWLFDRITPAWRRASGGCHPNRRTSEVLSASGLEVVSLERRRVNGLPMISGIARRPLG